MSAFNMLDMCVHYIARRHHMLTDMHVDILDKVWDLYESQELPPLPPSPPPERQHVHFEEHERHDKEERPKHPARPQWPSHRCLDEQVWECGMRVLPEQKDPHQDDCDCSICSYEDAQQEREEEERKWEQYYLNLQDEQRRKWREEEERQWKLDTLWRQVPQSAPVSASMQHQETCGCDTCESQDRRRVEEQQEQYEQEQQLPCCSDYLRSCDADGCTYECAAACGSSEPVIDLTCEKASCEYGCDCTHAPVGSAYPLPPIESCLYGCAFSCGAKQGEDCKAEFDAEGDQIPPLVASVLQAAVESDDEMPPLIHIGSRSEPKGWSTPQHTQSVTAPPAPKKAPKAKPIFPYNHHLWPSPRAKVLVRAMLGRRAKDVLNVETLTHEACMRYLAKHYGLSEEQLLKTSIFELHNPERIAWTRDSPKPYMSLPKICGCCYCRDGRHRW